MGLTAAEGAEPSPPQREYGRQSGLGLEPRSRAHISNQKQEAEEHPFETSKLTPSDISPLARKTTPNPPQLVAVQVFCVVKYSNVQEIFKLPHPSRIQ